MSRTTISFPTAVLFWLKLGFVSFGGPAGQIAIMHQELVERRRWISDRRFMHALNYCMLLPGPEAQQLATYIGWLMHRTWGGLIAGSLFVLPSFAILMTLSWGYMSFGSLPAVAAIFFGIKPAVVAIVAFAAWRVGRRVLRGLVPMAIALLAFIALLIFKLPFPLIIAAAAAAGWIGARLAPRSFIADAHDVSFQGFGPAIIDDDTPSPAHAQFRWRMLALIVAICGASWVGAMTVLLLMQGWDGTLPQMGWFFSKAALVTFGGAYAVLPYVYQGAVERYGWISAPQMIDGLALGETTPGPLIMVVTFVGYVGGWTHAAAQGLPPAIAGLSAATCVTFFTFLPSFFFIFAGGPLVEATRGRPLMTAPLAAISAAVVGVIANLAVFFAWHVFWPQGFGQRPEWISILIAGAAFIALTRFKLGVIPVVLAAGAAGLVVRLFASGLAEG